MSDKFPVGTKLIMQDGRLAGVVIDDPIDIVLDGKEICVEWHNGSYGTYDEATLDKTAWIVPNVDLEKEPEHHHRYRTAWTEYCTNLDEEVRIKLEDAMDSAQNKFTWKEFQLFKATLPGYCEYWNFLESKYTAMLNRMKKVNDANDNGTIE